MEITTSTFGTWNLALVRYVQSSWFFFIGRCFIIIAGFIMRKQFSACPWDKLWDSSDPLAQSWLFLLVQISLVITKCVDFTSLGLNFTCPAGKLLGRSACPAPGIHFYRVYYVLLSVSQCQITGHNQRTHWLHPVPHANQQKCPVHQWSWGRYCSAVGYVLTRCMPAYMRHNSVASCKAHPIQFSLYHFTSKRNVSTLTLSLPRVINFIFPLQPHQKY